MSKATKHSIFARIVAGLVMGSLTLALIGSTATIVPVQSAELGHPVVQLILPVAAIATVLIVGLVDNRAGDLGQTVPDQRRCQCCARGG